MSTRTDKAAATFRITADAALRWAQEYAERPTPERLRELTLALEDLRHVGAELRHAAVFDAGDVVVAELRAAQGER